MAEAPAHTPVRVVFVDVLRLIAAFQMIQGHSVDALLAPSYRAGTWFGLWSYVRGLTSTTFLVTAGMSLVLAHRRARAGGKGSLGRLRRGLFLISLGYLMHAPISVLFGTPWDAAYRELLSVDVLQCIGVSLIVLELLSLAVRRPERRALAAGALGLACFGAAPLAAQLVPAGPWFFAQSYFTSRGGSLFPLVPWLGYAAFGYAGALFALHGARTAARLALLAGGAFAAAGASALLLGETTRNSPQFSLVKLGIVLALAALLAFVLRRTERLPRFLTVLSGETLFLYVSHVLVLYAGHVGIKARWGGTQTPLMGLTVAVALMVVCSAVALLFERRDSALRLSRAGGTR